MASVDTLVEEIGKLTLTEAAELVKALEAKFGVTAAAPVMMASAAPAAAAGAAAPAAPVEEDRIWRHSQKQRCKQNQCHQGGACRNRLRLKGSQRLGGWGAKNCQGGYAKS